MTSATLQRSRRVQVGLLAGLLALSVLAWFVTRERMLGMDAGPGTDPGGLGFYVVSWVVMMSAMMFPSIAPMVLTFGFVQNRRRERAAITRTASTWMFVSGYILTWAAFGLLAYGLYVGIRSLHIAAFSWHRGGPYLAGGVLLAAAVYQLTPAKDACLSRCRSPMAFVLNNWHDGPVGAVRMGIVHGAWCVGCCWALMASLFALGVMSIPWMIGIAVLIALEKLLPQKRVANLLVAATLAVLGLGVALAPGDVPWLTLPDSPAAARAMRAMGMHGGSMNHSAPMSSMGHATSTGSMNHAAPMSSTGHSTSTGSMNHSAPMSPMGHPTSTGSMNHSMPTAPASKPSGAMPQMGATR
jgi:predicted metal-binding membrane protein